MQAHAINSKIVSFIIYLDLLPDDLVPDIFLAGLAGVVPKEGGAQ